MRKREFKNVEWSILIVAIILCVIGLIALFSATKQAEYNEFKKQLIWLGISIVFMGIVLFIDYENLARFSPYLYGVTIISLIAVLFTKSTNGATSWFNIGGFTLQPSEFAKIFVILFMATAIVKIQERNKDNIDRPTRLLILFGFFCLPLGLILIQPDIGTATAFIVAMGLMLIAAGIDKKYIIASILLVTITIPLVYKFMLPVHAKKRIDIFLNLDTDPRGAGYNIIQSKLAIGAGGVTGMGLLKGNQTQLGFLYPKTTDFIYAVIGEEMGFIVSAFVIILYVFLLTKALYVAKTAKDELGTIIATGIAGVFLFHVLENIGMVMGLLPITGVPLPFVSYGGSSLITNFVMIGILLNISGKRKKTIFIE